MNSFRARLASRRTVGLAAAAVVSAASATATPSRASAGYAWSARGPEDGRHQTSIHTSVAVGGGVIWYRDRRESGGLPEVLPYLLDLAVEHAVHRNVDIEFRLSWTGPAFAEGGARFRVGGDAVSFGARAGVLAGVGAQGAFGGVYPGALVSFGGRDVQLTFGGDVLFVRQDTQNSDLRSPTGIRLHSSLEFAVSTRTHMFARLLVFKTSRVSWSQFDPALVIGGVW